LDVAAVGGLLVSLSSSAAGLRAVVAAVRNWLARGEGTRRTVRLEIGGDVLELSEATVADQDRLVDLFAGRHAAGGLHLGAANNSVRSVPANRRNVYPVAAASLRIDVDARLVAAGGADIGYGIGCRASDGRGYAFMIWGKDIQIGKYLGEAPWYKTLWVVPVDQLGVKVERLNRLQAVCSGGDGQKSVHLAFWVNGRGLEITDRTDPFSTFAVTLPGSPRPGGWPGVLPGSAVRGERSETWRR
jgi:hypothetical protein